jgi:murein DD-endopeptidase MepM/ murein hydrolase activator NlpD
MVTSNSKLETRSVTLSKSWIILGGVLSVFAFTLFSFVVFDYSQLLIKEARNKFLHIQNQNLKAQVKAFSEKMEAVEVDLEKINRYSRKLKAITSNGQENPDEQQLELTLGKPLIDERKPANIAALGQSMDSSVAEDRSGNWFPVFKTASKEYSYLNPINKADLTLTFVKTSTKVKKVERDLTLLFERMASQRDLLSATPSVRPTGGWVSSGFGYRRDPFTGRARLHKGMDFAANRGTPVFAPADGVVSFSGREGGYGNIVSIDHGYGLVTRFAHNSKLLVKTGQRVSRWDKIAESGSTGRSSGPHVHYEVRLNGVPVDPEKYILNN